MASVMFANTGLEISPPVDFREYRRRSVLISADETQFETKAAATKFGFRFMIPIDALDFLGAAPVLEAFLQKTGYGTAFSQTWPEHQSLADIPKLNILNARATAAANTDEVSIRATAGRVPAVQKGRYFRFSNHNKLYRVEETISTVPTTSNVALSFYPNLTVAVPSGATIDLNPTINAKMAESTSLNVVVPAEGINMKMIEVREV